MQGVFEFWITHYMNHCFQMPLSWHGYVYDSRDTMCESYCGMTLLPKSAESSTIAWGPNLCWVDSENILHPYLLSLPSHSSQVWAWHLDLWVTWPSFVRILPVKTEPASTLGPMHIPNLKWSSWCRDVLSQNVMYLNHSNLQNGLMKDISSNVAALELHNQVCIYYVHYFSRYMTDTLSNHLTVSWVFSMWLTSFYNLSSVLLSFLAAFEFGMNGLVWHEASFSFLFILLWINSFTVSQITASDTASHWKSSDKAL